MSEKIPGHLPGWRVDSGLRYRGIIQVLDYEAVRTRAHLHWLPREVHEKEIFVAPIEHIEFPLANAAKQALKDMTEVDHELRKAGSDEAINQNP